MLQKLRTLSLCGIAALAVAACSDDELAGPRNDSSQKRASLVAGTWQTRMARPTASAAGFAVQIGSQIYSVGGAHAHLGEPSTLQVYDPAANTWAHRSPGAATHAWTAAEFGGRIYIFGGWDGGSVHTTTQVYDPVTDSWSLGTPVPRAHNGGAAGVIDGRIYVAAGGNSSGYVSITDVYDPVTELWSQAAPIPVPRAFVGGAVINGILYVVGGDNGGARSAALHAYDPVTDSWTTKAPMPTARAGAGAIAYDGKLYVIGGSTSVAYTNPDYAASLTALAEIYDPATNTWSVGDPMLTARQAPHIATGNGSIYVSAGYGTTGSVNVNETFEPTPPPPSQPTTKEQCLKGGWQGFGFSNQGQCVRYVQTGKDSRVAG